MPQPIFFAIKTPEEGKPFLVIVEGRETWQNHLAPFLHGILKTLPIDDAFLVNNSAEVVNFLAEGRPVVCMSADVKDLFYEIPREAILEDVEGSIGRLGTLNFQNQCGMSVRDFLDLLKLYLESLLIEYEGKIYCQREGICIGSPIAAVLVTSTWPEGIADWNESSAH